MITQETAIDYIKLKPSRCPSCKSTDIVGERFDTYKDAVTQEISCSACGLIYYDIYKLVGVGIIEPEAITEYYLDGRIEHG